MLDSILATMYELSPWFLLGMVVSGLLHGLLPRDFIKRQLQGRTGIAKAVSLGIPLPLCSCGVIPAGLGLKRDGASNGASMGFLISTPQTGVDSILVSASFLGWPFALFKVLAAAVTGLLGGWLSDRVTADEEVERDLGEVEVEDVSRGFASMLAHAYDLLASIWRWLVVGVLISAVIDTYLPMGTLGVFAELGPLAAGLTVLLVSLPLYVCATASVPIAAAMVGNGMPVGAALVFLMAGPATNVATIGAIYRGFGAKQLAVYLGVLIVGSIGFGVLFDLGISPASVTQHVHGEAPQTWLGVGSTLLLGGLIIQLAFADTMRFARQRIVPFFTNDSGEEIEISVAGLTCGACERKLEGALLSVAGVRSVVVSRNPDRAVVRGDLDLSAVHEAIAGAGYRTAVP
jgi:uncharacterized membrane protein YraQ (UPF0718 family)/copper chaperone CopZ